VQAECGPGLAQASDIDILSTLRDDNIINVHSSSSYELFLFFSKADSAHEGVDRLTLLQNTFIVSAVKISFVSALQADTIYTKNNYWYRLN
jgi:hypothetical protein